MTVRSARFLVGLAAMLCAMACGSDTNLDLYLSGTFAVQISGREGDEPFAATGEFVMSNSAGVVSGSWNFNGPPPGPLTGTLAGTGSSTAFDFALTPSIPLSPCGATLLGQATVSSTSEFSGILGGGCPGDEISANFVAQRIR